MFYIALIVALIAGISKKNILAAVGGFIISYVVCFLLVALGIISLAIIPSL